VARNSTALEVISAKADNLEVPQEEQVRKENLWGEKLRKVLVCSLLAILPEVNAVDRKSADSTITAEDIISVTGEARISPGRSTAIPLSKVTSFSHASAS